MTAQFSDLVIHDLQEFSLCGVQGDQLFDAASSGLETYATSTANYRGWIATYDTTGGHLYLDSLVVGAKTKFNGRPVALGQAVLGGTVVKAPAAGEVRIEHIAVPMRFTGRLLVGRHFVRSTYKHMGFHPGWKYKWVLDLSFDSGALVDIHNRSDEMAALRDGILAGTIPDPDGPGTDKAWIERTFTLEYARSGLA